MSNIKDSDLLKYELTHDHAGNGFFMVENIDQDWCRVTRADPSNAGKFCQAFLVWKKKISVFHMREDPMDSKSKLVPRAIPEKMISELETIRRGIACGEIEVVATRFRKASQHATTPQIAA